MDFECLRGCAQFTLDDRPAPAQARGPVSPSLADQIAAKCRLEVLEAKEGWRSPKPVKLSAHVATYVTHAVSRSSVNRELKYRLRRAVEASC